jgi:metallo-beta-lactamase family protein
VDLDGERVDIRAGIDTLGGYSAHADQQGLVNFVTRMRHWPSHIASCMAKGRPSGDWLRCLRRNTLSANALCE